MHTYIYTYIHTYNHTHTLARTYMRTHTVSKIERMHIKKYNKIINNILYQ